MYDIIVDDEGLLKDDSPITAIDSKGGVMLVGNLLFCNHVGPEFADITDDDIVNIKKSLMGLIFEDDSIGLAIKMDYGF